MESCPARPSYLIDHHERFGNESLQDAVYFYLGYQTLAMLLRNYSIIGLMLHPHCNALKAAHHRLSLFRCTLLLDYPDTMDSLDSILLLHMVLSSRQFFLEGNHLKIVYTLQFSIDCDTF